MSDGTIGVLLLVTVVIFASLLMHIWIGHFWLANSAAAAFGTTILHVAAYIKRGYADPFDVVSIPISFIVGLGISAFVGTAVRDLRRSRERKRNSDSNGDDA